MTFLQTKIRIFIKENSLPYKTHKRHPTLVSFLFLQTKLELYYTSYNTQEVNIVIHMIQSCTEHNFEEIPLNINVNVMSLVVDVNIENMCS